MTKKLIIFLIILAIIITAGAVFYFWPYPGPQPSNGNPPTLFSKDDYQIDERADGTYIVVEKAGLTAKVPENWTIEIEGDDFPTPQYWVNLSSPDAEGRPILQKGCGVSIMIGDAPEDVQEINQKIQALKEMAEIQSILENNYELTITTIQKHEGLHWTSKDHSTMGQFTGIDIPINTDALISFDAAFPPNYKEICEPIWQAFIDNVMLE